MGEFDHIVAAFDASPLFVEMAKMAKADDFSRLDKNPAKRQHFLAQFLLRGFSHPHQNKERLFQTETANRRAPIRVDLRMAASRHRLYEAPDETGAKSNRIEGYLAVVESHAAPALRHLRDDSLTLPDNDRATIAFFVALQTMRTPAALQQINALANAAFQTAAGDFNSDREAFTEAYRSRFGEDASEEEIERFRQETTAAIREGKVKIARAGGGAFSYGIRWAAEQAPLLFAFDWILLRAPAGFITSDRGFAMHDPTPPRPWAAQALLSSPNSETTMPLSETLCLLMQPGPGDGRVSIMDVSAKEVEDINLRTWGWADRHAFGATQEALVAVSTAARRRPADVVRPKPFCQVALIEIDPDDTSVAVENRRRGWLPRLSDSNGRAFDYIVIPTDGPYPELRARVDELVERRARKRAGTPEGESLPGSISSKLLHPLDIPPN